MNAFFHWLFTESDGHFALATIALIVCAAVWLIVWLHCGAAEAAPIGAAVYVLFQLFLTKLRSS